MTSLPIKPAANTTIPTTTVLAADPNPAAFGHGVTLTATVSTNGQGTPTGQVNFQDSFNGNITQLGSGTLNGSGVAMLPPISSLLGGTHMLTAEYVGDGNLFVPSSSNVISEKITQFATTTSLTALPSSNTMTVTYGETVTLTASISSPGHPVPSGGSVQFQDGGSNLGTPVPVASGTAPLILQAASAFSVGTHSLTALYSGFNQYAASTSLVVTEVVSKANSSTTMTSAPNPSGLNQSVTFSAQVSSAVGIPSGGVNFLDGSTLLNTITSPLDATGKASFTVALQTLGKHSITAVYSGDSNFNTSASPVLSQTVLYATKTALASNPNPSNFNGTVTLTATVTPVVAGPCIPATGTVTFLDGSRVLGPVPVPVNNAGVATMQVATLSAANSHALTARYSGDGVNCAGSVSSPPTVQVVTGKQFAVNLARKPQPASFVTPLTFTSTITNQSGASVNNVSFTALLTGNYLLVGSIDSGGVGSCANATLTCNLGTLQANQTIIVTFTITVLRPTLTPALGVAVQVNATAQNPPPQSIPLRPFVFHR